MGHWRLIVTTALIAAALSPSLEAADQPASKRVLILQQTWLSSQATAKFDAAFMDTLRSGSPVPVEVRVEKLESFRTPRERRVFMDYLRSKYGERHIDVLVAIGTPALVFATQNRALFGNPAIVAAAAREGAFDPAQKITGLRAGPAVSLQGTLDLIYALRPQTCCIAVVDGSRDPANELEREFRRHWPQRGRPIEVEYFRNLPMEELLPRISSLNRQSVVLFMRQTLRTASEDIETYAALQQVVGAAKVPVFTALEDHVGSGTLGGHVWQLDENGRRMADMTRQILNGAPVAQIPPGRASYINMLDSRQLQKWQISASRVPSGTIVLFSPRSLFNEHPRWFILGALVFTGQLALIVGLLVERSSRRRAEREVKRARENLAHLTRVSAVGELAASLAHELNQPLTGILGNARAAGHLLARGDAQPWQLKEIIQDIVEDDKRAADVIARMRDLVKKRTTERLPVDVHDVVRGVSQLVASDSIIRKVSVGLNLAPGTLVVEGDRVQLQQVLLNLVLNGIEATATAHWQPRTVLIATTLSDRSTVHVMVRDNGAGLVPGTERQIFDPFFTTKQSGMGMGLSIARSIVESHGGRIWAMNSSERGAEFHFTLPRLAAHTGRSWAIRRSA